MKRAVATTMIALTVAAIGGGLWMAGGPWEARKQDMDRDRFADLHDIVYELYCSDGTAPDALPDAGAPYCEGVFNPPDLVDPQTDAAYSYERIDDLRYRLCAEFHDAENLGSSPYNYRSASFDLETGCLTASVRER